jgi:magnesium transporter
LAAEVMAKITDRSYALSLTSLIRYPDTSAGGLMGRELIKVNKNWTVDQCTDEIRNQAEEVERVFTVYVVDDNGVLEGWISLKKILLANGKTTLEKIYDDNIIYLNTYAQGEEIAMIMKKYDLIALPIVDSFQRLVGRVTIDDVVDFITEEADRDYQLAAGISESVESSDRVWLLSRARLPWLIIGLVGGVANSLVIGGFEAVIQTNVQLAFFMPLVMAMGGNAGVQSSSIVVQGLANQTLANTGLGRRLGKEFMVSLLNGLICSAILLGYSYIVGNAEDITITVSLSLLLIIIFASLMGALIPLVLNRFNIDPALATGPFITTSNDLIGLLLYFYVGNQLMTQLL